jgi:hypothetical protein
MKRAFFVFLAFLALMRFASAHAFFAPTLETLAKSDSIYLVRVASITEGGQGRPQSKVTFSVTEVLKGDTRSLFVLIPYIPNKFKINSEWILFHHPSGIKDCVGWAILGDCEWLPISANRDGDKVTAQWVGSLDTIRDYLHQHPHP